MTELTMATSGPHTLLSHMTLYGLASILESAGLDVRARWEGRAAPRPTVTVDAADPDDIGAIVVAHASRVTESGSWAQRDIVLKGSPRGLMSPRLTPFGDDRTWRSAQEQRRDVIQSLTEGRAWLDLRLIAALGEPAYWSRNRKGELIPDDGASRLEMQPRNQGSEFVGSRLRKVASAVAARSPQMVVSGLVGDTLDDEAGSDRLDSRTATGFAGPGPTDNALAWCALWGISALPIAMRVSSGGSRSNSPARTSGHLGRGRREWFYAPIWHDDWTPARARTVLASEPLRVAAAAGLDLGGHVDSSADQASAAHWLRARGVAGVVRFPIERFGSDSAPERRAMRGEPVEIGGGL